MPESLFNGIENDPSEEFGEYALWTEPKNINQTIGGESTGNSSNPLIPAGFMPKNTDSAKWDAKNGPQADNGLVIVDTEGNEFVWVPVKTPISESGYSSKECDPNGGREGIKLICSEPDVLLKDKVYIEDDDPLVTEEDYQVVDGPDKNPAYLEKAGCEDKDKDGTLEADDFKAQLESEYVEMARSVNNNGGYYVGRYEVSIGSNSKAQSKRYETSATMAENSANTWYGLYALCNKYETSSVKSNMISGAQYDAMMEWMGTAANITISGFNKYRLTGYNETDKTKNVYDLYGNSYEYTLEVIRTESGYGRAIRGSYNDTRANDCPPSYRSYYHPTYNYNYLNNVGSRLALYIK